MTLIRILTPCEVDAIRYAAGQVVEFTDALASCIVVNGFGVEVASGAVTQEHSSRMQTAGDGEIGGPVFAPDFDSEGE
jgi:hypothetical protein